MSATRSGAGGIRTHDLGCLNHVVPSAFVTFFVLEQSATKVNESPAEAGEGSNLQKPCTPIRIRRLFVYSYCFLFRRLMGEPIGRADEVLSRRATLVNVVPTAFDSADALVFTFPRVFWNLQSESGGWGRASASPQNFTDWGLAVARPQATHNTTSKSALPSPAGRRSLTAAGYSSVTISTAVYNRVPFTCWTQWSRPLRPAATSANSSNT